MTRTEGRSPTWSAFEGRAIEMGSTISSTTFNEGDFFEMHTDRYARFEPLLKPVMKGGKRTCPKPTLTEIQSRARENLTHFHRTYLRQINPHIYKVSLTEQLKKLKMDKLVAQRKKSRQS